jgi:DNA-binding FrmR family transcriptional regulator
VRLSEDVLHDLELRLRRIEGQVRGVQRMLQGGRDCGEIVHQVAAIRVALAKVAMTVVSENLEECLAGQGAERDAALRRAKQAFLDLV